MALDLNQTNVVNDAKFAPMLTNLQANILKGHGRNFAHHLFFSFNPKKIEEAKNWISAFAENGITSAKKQVDDTEAYHAGKITDGGTVFTLSLSSAGYDELRVSALKPINPAFQGGLQASANLLDDNLQDWEEPFRSPIHLLIIVADDNSKNADTNAQSIISQVSSFATLLHNQRGNVLKMANQIGIEHFGYADGISQPLYFKNEIDKQASLVHWKDATPLRLLLVPDPGTDEEDSFGSFLVFRKLEQNVKLFKQNEDRLPAVKDVAGNDNDELAGAMIVGRFESGFPVINGSVDATSNPPEAINDFDYSTDTTAPGLKCPFHSHTRLMNPRNGITVDDNLSERRITRRGIPYDEVNRIPEDKITDITEEMLDSNHPSAGVGLLFMCYQSNINSQFEILQAFWANKGNIAGHMMGGEDSLIGQGTNPPKTLPTQWGNATQSAPFTFDKVTTMRGGEYFFTPSISVLKKIGSNKAVKTMA